MCFLKAFEIRRLWETLLVNCTYMTIMVAPATVYLIICLLILLKLIYWL